MPLEATVDLLIGQWVESPRLQAAIEAPLAIARDEILPALERVRLMHGIDHAEGVWLDYLGLRVGLRRPATTDPSQDLRFGFEGTPQARGFDQVPFAGDEANAAIYPLHDRIFRNFVRARGPTWSWEMAPSRPSQRLSGSLMSMPLWWMAGT